MNTQIKLRTSTTGSPQNARDKHSELLNRLDAKYHGDGYKKGSFEKFLQRPASSGKDETDSVEINGLSPNRIIYELLHDRGRGFRMSDEVVEALMDKFMAPHRRIETGKDLEGNPIYRDMNQKEQDEANALFDTGMLRYKRILHDDLRSMQSNYGAMLSQMHPHDILQQFQGYTGERMRNYHLRTRSMQNMFQLFQEKKGGQRYLSQDQEENQNFKKLLDYYGNADLRLQMFVNLIQRPQRNGKFSMPTDYDATYEQEQAIKGPKMTPEQFEKYKERLRERMKNSHRKKELYGRYAK